MSDSQQPSDFERLGGETGLRRIIERFTEQVYQDAMIGFFFHGKDQDRITEMEYRHAAEYLGGPVVYDGKPIAKAHQPLGIMGGQFMRRRKISEHWRASVSPDIRERWLAHVDSFAMRSWEAEPTRVNATMTNKLNAYPKESPLP